jgi:hypothetical protein
MRHDETSEYECKSPPRTAEEAWDEAMRRDRPWRRRKRRALLEGMLSQECPDCGAASATSCDYNSDPDWELLRVNRDPLIVAHTTRVAAAIKAGAVDRAWVLAQFDETPPEGLRGV